MEEARSEVGSLPMSLPFVCDRVCVLLECAGRWALNCFFVLSRIHLLWKNSELKPFPSHKRHRPIDLSSKTGSKRIQLVSFLGGHVAAVLTT